MLKLYLCQQKTNKQTNKQTNKSFKFHACQDHHLTAATEICQSGYLNWYIQNIFKIVYLKSSRSPGQVFLQNLTGVFKIQSDAYSESKMELSCTNCQRLTNKPSSIFSTCLMLDLASTDFNEKCDFKWKSENQDYRNNLKTVS